MWNGITYAFFGFGAEVGALGIEETAIYGPENGILGLVLNVIFATVFWRWMVRQAMPPDHGAQVLGLRPAKKDL